MWWERGNSNPLPPASQPDFLISMNKTLAHRDSGGGNQANRIFSVRERSGAARWGLVNTMVLTHLPSNILLILVPLMPNLSLAVLALLLRFSISQMDVPTRQSYVMAVVSRTSGPRPPESRAWPGPLAPPSALCSLGLCLRGFPG